MPEHRVWVFSRGISTVETAATACSRGVGSGGDGGSEQDCGLGRDSGGGGEGGEGSGDGKDSSSGSSSSRGRWLELVCENSGGGDGHGAGGGGGEGGGSGAGDSPKKSCRKIGDMCYVTYRLPGRATNEDSEQGAGKVEGWGGGGSGGGGGGDLRVGALRIGVFCGVGGFCVCLGVSFVRV